VKKSEKKYNFLFSKKRNYDIMNRLCTGRATQKKSKKNKRKKNKKSVDMRCKGLVL